MRKDFIREGKWTIKKQGNVLPVDKDRIKKWERNFQLFRQRGISVPLTVDHIQVTDAEGKPVLRKLTPGQAEAKRGNVVNLFEQNGLGMFDAVPADKDAEALMLRCPEVSLEMEKDFVDGHGNYYDEAITAITLTPIPIIPGQKMEWERVDYSTPEKIAASRDPRDGTREIICLSAEPFVTSTTEKSMLPALLARIRTALAMPNDSEEVVHTKMVERLEASKTLMSREALEAEQAPKIKEKDEQIVKLSRDLESAKAGTRVITVEDLARDADPDTLDMAVKAYKTQISALGARATPKQKEMLNRLADPKNIVALSRKAAKQVGLGSTLLDTVLEIFEAADLTEMNKLLTEQSKEQVKLNRAADSAAGGEDKEDKTLLSRMIESGNLHTAQAGSKFVM